MFARIRSLVSRRLVLSLAACGALALLWAPSAHAQMCASGGTTAGTGTTGTTTGTTTSGTTASRSTGSTSGSSNTLTLFQAAQTARQLQIMAEQQSRVEAFLVAQALQYETGMNIVYERQIELRRATRLANAQKQRELRARKSGKPLPRREVALQSAGN